MVGRASLGRSGVSSQAIAAFDIALWDLKAKRAQLPIAKPRGAQSDSVETYNTSGGFLHAPIERLLDNATAALAIGIGIGIGIKIEVGQPDWRTEVARLEKDREHLGADVPLMVDANQQGPPDRDEGPGLYERLSRRRLPRRVSVIN